MEHALSTRALRNCGLNRRCPTRTVLLAPLHFNSHRLVFVEKGVYPSFDSWITSLDALSALRPSHVVGAHYGMGDAAIISAYRGYFTALRERVAEMKRQGKSSDETAITLRNEFRAKYPDWDQPLRVYSAAAAVYAELP